MQEQHESTHTGDFSVYLGRMLQESEKVNAGAILRAIQMWDRLRLRIPRLPEPVAGPDIDGRMEVAWCLGWLNLNIHIGEWNRCSWFYEDLDTGEFGSSENLTADEVFLAAVPRLRGFAPNPFLPTEAE